MKINCPCERVTLSLPDEKLPAAGRFVIGCPECGKKVRISRSPYGTEAAFADEAAAENGAPQAAQQAPDLGALAEQDAPPAANADASAAAEAVRPRFVAPRPIPPERPSLFAAVRDANVFLAIKAYAREQGHYLRKAPQDPDEAACDLRLNPHALCLIEDAPEFAGLVAETLALSGERRRVTGVVLLGDFEDFDPKSAFYKGADAVLQKSETADFPARLDAAVRIFRRRAARREKVS